MSTLPCSRPAFAPGPRPRLRAALRSGLATSGLLLGGLLGVAGCGASFPPVLSAADIGSLREGSPRIARVRDLGAAHIGRPGPLQAEPDGRIVMGELILIEGSGFGIQPAAGIGSRSGEILWRTSGGGIVMRVPVGSAAGRQTAWVQAGFRRTEAPVELHRIGLVLDTRRGKLHTVLVRGDADATPGVTAAGAPLDVPDARALAISPSGAAAYVLQHGGGAPGGGDRIAIVDLAAPGGPRITETRPLRHAVHSLVVAERDPVLAAVGPDQVTLWDLTEARRPAPWAPAPLPEEVQGAHAAALDPSGTLLGLAVAETNQVLLVRIKPGLAKVSPRLVGQIAALPSVRQPVLHSLRFSADGETLWLTSGDTVASRPAGHQPTRVTAIRIAPPSGEAGAAPAPDADRTLEIRKTIELRDAGAPVRFSLARAQPVAAGSAIRTPPETSTLFLTTVAPAALDGKAPADGALLKSDLGGAVTPLVSGKEALVGLDVSPDAGLALLATAAAGPDGLQVAAVPTRSGAAPARLSLGAAESTTPAPPFDQYVVVLQP